MREEIHNINFLESPTKMSYVTENPMLQEQKRHRGNPNWGIAKPYDEVRAYIKPMKFKSFKEYQDWVREEREAGRGEGFPLNPHMVYARKNEWISREHFLGFTDNITTELVQASEDLDITHKFSFRKIRSIINQILGIKPSVA